MTLRDAETAEKRAKLRQSLATGKPLADPTIANDKELRKDYAYDESRPDRTLNEELDLDDEYSQLSGIVEPRVLVTTSRDQVRDTRCGFRALEIAVFGISSLICSSPRDSRRLPKKSDCCSRRRYGSTEEILCACHSRTRALPTGATDLQRAGSPNLFVLRNLQP